MMLWFTDGVTNKPVALNPEHVVAVFVIPEGELAGKTGISLINGSLTLAESDVDVVGKLNGVQ